MSLTDGECRPAWLPALSDPRNEAILSAAFDVFQEKGLHGATMLEIATAAKVSKETLYARFDNKEGLFYALLAWGSERMMVDLANLEQQIDADPVGALKDFATACLTKMMHAESIEISRIVISEARRMPEIARVYDEFTCKTTTAMLDRVVDALEAKGLARIGDRPAFADAFIGLLRGNMHHHVTIGVAPPPTPEALEAQANRAVAYLLRIFAPANAARTASAA